MYTAPIQPTEYLTLTKEIIMQIQIAEEVKEKYGLYKKIIQLNNNYKIITVTNITNRILKCFQELIWK